ncbi:MAG: hypothetical protein IKN39_01230 [Clostridia bacterium]|nr:hypothetical protein [Clostridia bacterium]
MLNKSLFKLTAVLLTVLISFTMLSSCKNKKYVYGTTSDFIEVSHPDKPNVNKFSQDELDTSSNEAVSSQNTSQGDSVDSKSSDEINSEVPGSSNTGNSDTNGKTNETSSGSADNAGEKISGDQSPVVTFQ